MSTAVMVLLVYLLFLAGLAIWSRRETKTLSGFFSERGAHHHIGH
jgi:hypothetical protein